MRLTKKLRLCLRGFLRAWGLAGQAPYGSLKQIRGRLAESVACAFLERQGLVPVGRNLRVSSLEIDLLMLDGPVWVFVEVRARSSAEASHFPWVSALKKQSLRRAVAQLRRRYIPDREAVHRIDLVCVYMRPFAPKTGRDTLPAWPCTWHPSFI